MFEYVPLPKEDQLSDPIREILAGLPQLNIFRMVANMPNILPAYVEFGKALYNIKFDRKLRQMALLRASEKIPSKYLSVQYARLCKELGVPDREIEAIHQENPVVSLSMEANFLCKVADEITMNSRLMDETFHTFYKRYSIEVGSELLFFLSAANMIGRFINGTRVQIEVDNPLEGQSSAFPE